jgi:hypothetical protein
MDSERDMGREKDTDIDMDKKFDTDLSVSLLRILKNFSLYRMTNFSDIGTEDLQPVVVFSDIGLRCPMSDIARLLFNVGARLCVLGIKKKPDNYMLISKIRLFLETKYLTSPPPPPPKKKFTLKKK